jgi:predicted Rossmann fold nucleotide-binding protein DprA/Smf involved in DNA uptake
VQEKIVAAIGKHPATVDDIVDAAALPAQVVVAELTLLQIHGMVRRHTNNRFVTT